MSNGPFDLSKTPLHLGSIDGVSAEASNVVPLTGFGFDGPSFEAYINEHCQSSPGRIIMVETSPVDWPIWERHTKGAEIVVVLDGAGVFIQNIDGEQQQIKVAKGSAVVNPAGVWHTMNVETEVTALYMTPADGTEHKDR